MLGDRSASINSCNGVGDCYKYVYVDTYGETCQTLDMIRM